MVLYSSSSFTFTASIDTDTSDDAKGWQSLAERW